jgi:hypothetical protein
MNICSFNHDAVAYSTQRCPVCEIRASLEERNKLLKSQIDRLNIELTQDNQESN